MTCVPSEVSETPRLIWVFVGCTGQFFFVLSCCGSFITPIFTSEWLLLFPFCVSEDELYTQELLLFTSNGSFGLGVVGSDELPGILIFVGLGLLPLQEISIKYSRQWAQAHITPVVAIRDMLYQLCIQNLLMFAYWRYKKRSNKGANSTSCLILLYTTDQPVAHAYVKFQFCRPHSS